MQRYNSYSAILEIVAILCVLKACSPWLPVVWLIRVNDLFGEHIPEMDRGPSQIVRLFFKSIRSLVLKKEQAFYVISHEEVVRPVSDPMVLYEVVLAYINEQLAEK